MFALTSAGVRLTPSAFADTRRNWLPSPLTSSWLLAVQLRGAAAGHARCADKAPEVYGLDELGYCVPHVQQVPEPLREQARKGAAYCPEEAIRLIED